MSNTILIKQSSTPNAVPTTVQLAYGELAVNTHDGRLYTKIDTGTPSVYELTQNQPITVIGNVTGTSTNGVGNSTIDLTLTTTGVTANTYGGSSGSSTNVGVFTVDEYGRITSASNVAISTSSISNGTSNIQIFENGNITITSNGVANVAVFSSDGEYVNGLLSVTGDITGGNVNTAGYVSATGDVTGGNVYTGGAVSATGLITGGNIETAGYASATGNVTGGNINTGGQVSASGDVSGNNLYGQGEVSVVGNVTGGNVNTAGVVTATGTITGGNLETGGTVSATGTITGGNLATGGTLSATGNANVGNMGTAGQVTATGNITGGNLLTVGNTETGGIKTDNYMYANGAPVDFQQAAGANTEIQYNLNGDFGATSAFAFNADTNLLTINNVSIDGANGNIAGATGTSVQLWSDDYAQLNYNNEAWLYVQNNGIWLETQDVSSNNWTVQLDNEGNLNVQGNVVAGNYYTTGNASVSGNVSAGNVNVSPSGIVQTPVVTNLLGNVTIVAGTGTDGNINIWPDGLGNVVFGKNYLNGLKDPVQDQDAATKNYVDNAVAAGIDIHTAALADSETNLAATYADGGTTPTWTNITSNTTLETGSAHGLAVNDVIVFGTTTNGITANQPYFVYSVPSATTITLSDNYNGEPIVNLSNGAVVLPSAANTGVGATLTSDTNGPLVLEEATLGLNNRVLVLGQTNQTENGIYYVSQVGVADPGGSPWILTRALDGDKYGQKNSSTLGEGAYFLITGGAEAGDSYVCNTVDVIVFGTTNITFAQFGQVRPIIAGDGLSYTGGGTTLNVNVDNITTAIVGDAVVVKDSAQFTTPNIGVATGTSLSVTGNITGGNLITSGSGGNITMSGGNITGANNISATGTITSGNLATGGTVSATGNITGGNVTTAGTVDMATGIVSVLLNVSSSTNSTSTTTGAVTIAGGLGVVGNIYAGDMYSGGDSVLTVNSTIDGGTY